MGWKKPEKQTRALKTYTTIFTSGNSVAQSVVDSLLLQVKKWSVENILVVGFRFPASDELMAIEDSLSGFDEKKLKTAFIRNGGTWLSFEKGKYHTYDGSHLGADEAKRFTEDIVMAITPYLKKENKKWIFP